jgi:hypothetical protein
MALNCGWGEKRRPDSQSEPVEAYRSCQLGRLVLRIISMTKNPRKVPVDAYNGVASRLQLQGCNLRVAARCTDPFELTLGERPPTCRKDDKWFWTGP